jgi:small-conductance mechanosensitive channel
VFNYSGDFPFLWDEIRIPVKYGSDRARARAMLERVGAEIAGPFAAEAAVAWREIAARYRVEEAVLAPVVTLVANDNWIEYTLRYPVHYRTRRAVKDRLWSRILDEIDAAGTAVGLASATVQIVEAPPLEVRLRPMDAPPGA